MRPEFLFPLFKNINTLKGVGPRLSSLMSKLAGEHVIDLLWHLPTGLVTRQKIERLSADYVTHQIIVEVTITQHNPSRNRRVPYRVQCDVEGRPLTLTFFNGREDYLKRKLPVGQNRIIAGKLEEYAADFQITHPDHILEKDELEALSIHEPVYPLTAGVTNNTLSKAIRQALELIIDMPEWIDPALFAKEKWPNWKAAILNTHNPTSEHELEPLDNARQRLAYDELLSNQLALELVRQSMKRKAGRSLMGTGDFSKMIEDTLPFRLTGGQLGAIAEISADMKANYRMLRLVQGDVGSGKTMVALMAILQAVESGAQAALMAPTEILARQHMEGLTPYLERLGLKTGLITGRLKGKKREALLAELAAGDIHVASGTHALFQE
ncbi:MAG: DEAD/DEAH box helicase, partial [Sneathiellales bacterium]|nr:DEAD/DEAH box helicase [Sneathiellales bacterium]